MLSRKILVWAIILLSSLFVLSCSQEKKQKKAAVKSTKVQYTAIQQEWLNELKTAGIGLSKKDLKAAKAYLVGGPDKAFYLSITKKYWDSNKGIVKLLSKKATIDSNNSQETKDANARIEQLSVEIAGYDERHKAFEAELEANAAKMNKDAQFNKYYEQYTAISDKMIKENRLPTKEEAKLSLICTYYFKLSGLPFTETILIGIKNDEKIAKTTFEQITAEIKASYAQ